MIFIYLLVLAKSQTTQTYVCDDANVQTYDRGSNINICVFYISGTSTFRVAYQLVVDDFTAILSPGAYKGLATATGNVQVLIKAGTQLSIWGTYYIFNGQVAPILNAVIDFTSGTVSTVAWTNCCFGVNQCLTQSYTVSGTTYSESLDYQASSTCTANASVCDPKIYLTFAGTGSGGGVMTSDGYRMCKYRQYSVAAIYQNAQSAFTSAISNV